MAEKWTTSPSFKIKIEIEKINEFKPNIPRGKITKLNELICTGAKLICDKLVFPKVTRTEILNLNGKSGHKDR